MNSETLVGLLVLVLFVLYLVFRHPPRDWRGAIGESRVANRLKKLPRADYYVLHDLLLRTSAGTSQIDHLVVSPYGLFVIETKNYRGWIHGHENSEYWTQSIYRYKQKFRNPIKQNWSHLYALKELLADTGPIPYFPIVVFAGSAELKNVSTKVPVIYDEELVDLIYSKSQVKVLTEDKVEKILTKLDSAALYDARSARNHLRQVQSVKVNRGIKTENNVCPKCSGTLILRKGKYGEFYGCSRYPACRYSRNLSPQ